MFKAFFVMVFDSECQTSLLCNGFLVHKFRNPQIFNVCTSTNSKTLCFVMFFSVNVMFFCADLQFSFFFGFFQISVQNTWLSVTFLEEEPRTSELDGLPHSPSLLPPSPSSAPPRQSIRIFFLAYFWKIRKSVWKILGRFPEILLRLTLLKPSTRRIGG